MAGQALAAMTQKLWLDEPGLLQPGFSLTICVGGSEDRKDRSRRRIKQDGSHRGSARWQTVNMMRSGRESVTMGSNGSATSKILSERGGTIGPWFLSSMYGSAAIRAGNRQQECAVTDTSR